MLNIPITKPYFNDDEIEAVKKVINSGWVSQGSKVKEFEDKFADYLDVAVATATNSCATALHLALVVLGIGKNDEVILPSFTHVATANAVEYTGARPVFVDIDLGSYNIDVHLLGKAITKKTKAIIPVHLFGLSGDMDPILDIAQKYKLSIIEDAACSHGAEYKGKRIGGIGDIGCFSFHPRKLITTGEGGMLTTHKEEYKQNFESLRSHGASTSDLSLHEEGICLSPEFNILGYNYRMTDLQAAIGIEQLNKLESIISRRIELAKVYNDQLKDMSYIGIPSVPQDSKHIYQSYVILIKDNSPVSRNDLMKKLQEKGIATRQGTHAVHNLGYYRNKYNLKYDTCLQSFKAEQQTLTLPLYPQMTPEEQEYVIENLRNIF